MRLKNSRAIIFLLFYLGPHLWHMEVPRLGVKSELQLPAYATAAATWDPSRVCDLPHSWILNPLSKAWNQTRALMYTSWVCYYWATMGTPVTDFLQENWPSNQGAGGNLPCKGPGNKYLWLWWPHNPCPNYPETLPVSCTPVDTDISLLSSLQALKAGAVPSHLQGISSSWHISPL